MIPTVIGILQAVALVLVAPLVSGIVSKTKARMQGRGGASVLQPYRDIRKLLGKDSTVSGSTSWLFRAVPFVCMGSMIVLAMMTPFIYTGTLAPFGDLVAVVYLFTLYRFSMVLGGLEGGSAFGGMGSSREMMMSVLIEPALLLAISTLAILSGAGTDMGDISESLSGMGLLAVGPALILAGASFTITLLAENARIPFDNPSTHLELTMVHEAMLLEYSGRGLAMMELSSMVRLTVFMAMLGSMFFPWGVATTAEPVDILVSVAVTSAKMLLMTVTLAAVESVLCKTRLFKTPNLLTASFMLSLMAMMSLYIL
ncbi:MAG: NADH-quinone oxidoreductase subunit H [Candidatus Methanomethylophilaceae archaeon]|nr:NADH-quinone oxidoreductase subunit H [Candidatus Methanomethylophilaceae archaeon]